MSVLIPGIAPLYGSSQNIESLVRAQTGLIFWGRSDFGVVITNDRVSRWDSLLGGSVYVTQGTEANRPTVATDARGLPYLACGAGNVSSILLFADGVLSSCTEAEAFFVINQTEVHLAENGYGGVHRITNSALEGHYPINDAGTIYDNFGMTTRKLVGTFTRVAGPQLLNMVSAPDDWRIYRNGALLSSATTHAVAFSSTNQCLFGNTLVPALFHKGPAYEVILYSRKRTTTERAQIQAYIAQRNLITMAS